MLTMASAFTNELYSRPRSEKTSSLSPLEYKKKKKARAKNKMARKSRKINRKGK